MSTSGNEGEVYKYVHLSLSTLLSVKTHRGSYKRCHSAVFLANWMSARYSIIAFYFIISNTTQSGCLQISVLSLS